MHIARHAPLELIVVSGSRWVSTICAVAALFYNSFVITRYAPKGYPLLTAFLLLFALIMDLRKTFTFNATQKIVSWLRANSAQKKNDKNDKGDADTRETPHPISAMRFPPLLGFFLVLCSVSGTLVGCQTQSASIHIHSAGPTTVDAGDTVTVTAIVENDSSNPGVTWTISNLPISSVSTSSTQATFTPSAS